MAAPDPAFIAALQHLAAGEFDLCAARLHEVLAREPGNSEAWYRLGMAQWNAGRLVEAEAALQQALRLEPARYWAMNYLGRVLRDQARPVDAMLAFRAALTLNPQHHASHFELGAVLLQLGHFAEGWRAYEHRFLDAPHLRPDLPLPRWQGEDLAGKAILLIGEQGLGDQLQFLRYASEIARRGAVVDVLVAAPLVRLAQTVPGVRRAWAEIDLTQNFYDFQAQLMSLPMQLCPTLADIPGQTPYFFVDEQSREAWRERLAAESGAKLRVGLVWAGGQRADDPQASYVDRRRSLRLAEFLPLATLPGIRFYSLQKGAPRTEISAWLAAGAQMIDHSDLLNDFYDTAALVANLDLVIACDTSIVHLAGALKKPVWVLNRFDACWRWLINRSDSPWYPSARLFRQSRPHDWPPVIAEIRQALVEMLATRSS